MRQTHSVQSIVVGSLLLIALLLVGCHSGSKDAGPLGGGRVGLSDTQLLGDMDNNGEPSVGDAIMILRIVVGLDDDDACADANVNGSTDVGDAIKVLRCVVGLDDWPLGECRPAPTGTLSGIHSVTNFVVGDDERIACISDVTVQCETATISGEIYGVDGSAFGADGVSVTIEAQGDVTLTGAMYGGAGAAGSLMTNSGQGGNGGSVTIISANGDITIGAEVQTSAEAPQSYLGGGDAGVGADDLTTAVPGAGGQGGSVSVSCPHGLLTLYPRSGLIHLGNGGDGGTGHVPADFEGELSDPPEQTADGGNSGLLTMECDEFTGLAEQAGALVVEPVDMLTGGNGGDGGGLWIGVEVGTPIPVEMGNPSMSLRSVETAVKTQARGAVHSTQADDEGIKYRRSGSGGNAVCPGKPGDGADGLDELSQPPASWGGNGGDASLALIKNTEFQIPLVFPGETCKGGAGGEGFARARPVSEASDCQDGGHGQSAYAKGGNGGRVLEGGLLSYLLEQMNIEGGPGGAGRANAAGGGDAGDCCYPESRVGKAGGDAGKKAIAVGGNGGDQEIGKGGAAGKAIAVGGDGGDGGNGIPPGAGGKQTETVKATAGEPGEGSPRGGEGTTETEMGEPGEAGERCPGDPEPTTTYGVVTSRSTSARIFGFPDFYTTTPTTTQLEAGFVLGGTNFMVLPQLGSSMIFNSDSSVLWVADEFGCIAMYSNPLSGGDRAPDRALKLGHEDWRGIWYDEQRDIIYGASFFAALIYAWDGASGGSADRPPDRSFEVAGYVGGARLTGSPGSDRLFVAARVDTVRKVLVYDQAHLASGLQAPSRIIEPQDFDTHALAWDGQRNILYLGGVGGQTIHVYDAASTLQGAVTPSRTIAIDFQDMAADDWISALVVVPDDNLLFVSMHSGQVMVFANASGLSGTPLPATRAQAGDAAIALGVFLQ
jgi:hypothetical protein